MQSNKTKSKFIKNWISKEAKDEQVANPTVTTSTHPQAAGYQFHCVNKNGTTGELVETFLSILKSGYNSNYDGKDWTVEIVIADRNATLYIDSRNNLLSQRLVDGTIPTGQAVDARMSIPYEDLRILTNFETDYVAILIRNPRVDKPDDPIIRPLSDLLFAAYNLHYLKPHFNNTLVQNLYKTGKVSNLAGIERFIFPWAISSDIGGVLYDIISKYDLKRSMEIGLAYGLSGLFMTQAHKDRNYGHHTSVDPCQTVEFQSIGIDQIKKAGHSAHFRLLEAKDYDILPVLVKEQEKFDFIFIDGLHMHDYVVIDYFYSDLLLEVNGFMAFDDCHAPGVSSAVAYMEENRNYQFIASDSDHRLRVYKKLAEDNRTINDPNRHIEYFDKYNELIVSQKQVLAGLTGDPVTPAANQDIAVVGLDGLLPQGQNIEQFWQSIANETLLYGRFDRDYLYNRDKTSAGDDIVAGMISRPFAFDPEFFNISHNEAELMDPQLRQLLMSVHKAIEDAGYTNDQLASKTVGVFVGAEGSGYNELHRETALHSGYLLNHTASAMANRVSHYFDFTGPSEVIDTMCSSGAYGLHRAARLLSKGEIDMAIVGAVKLNMLNNVFESLNQLNITSTNGQCFSFHQQSKGYIRSEAIVTVVLTRSADAQSAGDHCYAIIKASAVNFNGKDGNSMFSPSKFGQKQVMKQCYEQAGVSMTDLAFIEAQGMGNEISDFVEYNAINDACNELLQQGIVTAIKTDNRPVITTVKPILGHLECASALGALLKVILTFRTQTIHRVANLTPLNINAKLDIDGKHFSLLTNNQVVDNGQPMLAGLNSFGASGSNVHLLLQQPKQAVANPVSSQAQLLTVSAKSVASLRQYVSNISQFIGQSHSPTVLADVCKTFQLHRNSYEFKATFYVGDGQQAHQIQQLQSLLGQYLNQAVLNQATNTGHIRDNQHNSHYHFNLGLVGTPTDALYQDGLNWLTGHAVDFKSHHPTGAGIKAGRMPSYPFDLQDYKLPLRTPSAAAATGVHPLVHRNSSNLAQQSFTSSFNGQEAFLLDHQVNGDKIFPGMAYVEMVREAITQATPDGYHKNILELSNVVWTQPMVVNNPLDVTIALYSEDFEHIEFDVFSKSDQGKEISHSEGQAKLVNKPLPLQLNVAQLQCRMGRQVDVTQLHQVYANMGINYGPSHRGLSHIALGDNELLAQVNLPAQCRNDEGYSLHPGLLDSALQASLALMGDIDQLPSQPGMPFAVDNISIVAPLATPLYAWVRFAQGTTVDDTVVKMDIDLCDAQGQVAVQLRGFSSRTLAGKGSTVNAITATVVPAASPAQTTLPTGERGQCVAYFQNMVAKTLKAAPGQLLANKNFNEFGLDSVLVVQLTNELRQVFDNVSGTLFFEVQTIDGLVDYFMNHQRERLIQLAASVTVNGGREDKA
jgi:acyl transferase domain-containing protein/predicted O-methyltransferase YrrM